jgi:cystathionine beta-lyase/cystathionine gamma-synthase
MFQGQTSSKVVFIVGNELYTDTPRLLKHFTSQFSSLFAYEQVSCMNSAEIIGAASKHREKGMSERSSYVSNSWLVKCFFFESCTNPSGQMIDFEILDKLKQICPKSSIVIDNTWLSSEFFNPFLCSNSVDYVVNSLTKYYSGGKCIAGTLDRLLHVILMLSL